MNEPRKPKKSETLEVRMPFEMKRDFQEACREDGTTASDVVRGFVGIYLDDRARAAAASTPPQIPERSFAMKLPKQVPGARWLAAGAGALGLSLFALSPSFAEPDLKALFKRLDANGDGVVTVEEFAAPPAGDRMTAAPRQAFTFSTSTVRSTASEAGGGETVKEDAAAFWLPAPVGAVPGGEGAAFEKRIEITRQGDAPAGSEGKTPVRVEKRVIIINDGDGEGKAGPDDHRARDFTAFDRDGDGRISFTEFQARHLAMLTRGFDLLDRDGSKDLSLEEYAKIVSPPPLLTPPGGDDGIPAELAAEMKIQMEAMAAPAIDPAAVKAQFTALDKDGDGRLSLAEYLPPA